MCDPVEKATDSASSYGSDKVPGDSSASCVKWKVNVTLKSSIKSWPDDLIAINLDLKAGEQAVQPQNTRMISTIAPSVVFRGIGTNTYTVKTEIKKWKTEIKDVSLKANDDESVELEIEPENWVQIKLIDNETGKRINGATIRCSQGKNNLAITTPDVDSDAKKEKDEILIVSEEGNIDLAQIEHDDTWEFVSAESV